MLSNLISLIEKADTKMAVAYDALYEVETILGMTGHQPKPNAEDIIGAR